VPNFTPTIEQSDNLLFMDKIEEKSIDLIYCDILYGTGKKFRDFEDLKNNKSEVEGFYTERIRKMSLLLKDTGSIYLQMDTKINHWIRNIMDNFLVFRNEIVWNVEYRLKQQTKKYTEFGERILFYTKTNDYYYKPQLVEHKTSKEHQERCKRVPSVMSGKFKTPFKNGKHAGDVWNDIKPLTYKSKENTGYNTQKPKKLIERIILSSSKENDVVADFFMGSGTTAVVCKEQNRVFIGCDISDNAVKSTLDRLRN